MPYEEPQLVYRNGWYRTVGYIRANIFELLVAFSAVIASVTYWASPHDLAHSSVARVGFEAELWNTLYGVGGVLIAIGIATRRQKIEAAGLGLFGGAILINVYALYEVRSLSSASSIAIFAAFFAASLIRGHDIIHNVQMVEHPARGEESS